ncbi:hypothetical protein MBM_07503 [Drepanopeziza brunnea f. sp. 'multigermtubi' MB_m1]|uniref:Uncharacterized protein n=1 Tax=Marssonina brunnea f. sp. multigermtubi (strain MB_m1) TaxID=1072389 RepID=K1X075_MARBU|nr:uncharacterized protein MBM_07503 [Drepanopeziza brunnea f. sp. 'multigermtubi' MB_m1]EKD14273.1 hypothetical protein MBM_07503 [Drepanopeziza brunnea f. sp. 'multigermtubi' MB_m1]
MASGDQVACMSTPSCISQRPLAESQICLEPIVQSVAIFVHDLKRSTDEDSRLAARSLLGLKAGQPVMENSDNLVVEWSLEYHRDATQKMCEAYRAEGAAGLQRRAKIGPLGGGLDLEVVPPANPSPNPGDITPSKTGLLPGEIGPEIIGPDGSSTGLLPKGIIPEVQEPDSSTTSLSPIPSTTNVPRALQTNKPGAVCPDCTVSSNPLLEDSRLTSETVLRLAFRGFPIRLSSGYKKKDTGSDVRRVEVPSVVAGCTWKSFFLREYAAEARIPLILLRAIVYIPSHTFFHSTCTKDRRKVKRRGKMYSASPSNPIIIDTEDEAGSDEKAAARSSVATDHGARDVITGYENYLILARNKETGLVPKPVRGMRVSRPTAT